MWELTFLAFGAYTWLFNFISDYDPWQQHVFETVRKHGEKGLERLSDNSWRTSQTSFPFMVRSTLRSSSTATEDGYLTMNGKPAIYGISLPFALRFTRQTYGG
jgi:hypothetical protein